MRDETPDIATDPNSRPTPGMTRSITPELIQHINFRKGRVMAIAQYPHPDDQYLFTVCVKKSDGELVTWIYNADDGGFFHGHYFAPHDLAGALADFAERMKK